MNRTLRSLGEVGFLLRRIPRETMAFKPWRFIILSVCVSVGSVAHCSHESSRPGTPTHGNTASGTSSGSTSGTTTPKQNGRMTPIDRRLMSLSRPITFDELIDALPTVSPHVLTTILSNMPSSVCTAILATTTRDGRVLLRIAIDYMTERDDTECIVEALLSAGADPNADPTLVDFLKATLELGNQLDADDLKRVLRSSLLILDMLVSYGMRLSGLSMPSRVSMTATVSINGVATPVSTGINFGPRTTIDTAAMSEPMLLFNSRVNQLSRMQNPARSILPIQERSARVRAITSTLLRETSTTTSASNYILPRVLVQIVADYFDESPYALPAYSQSDLDRLNRLGINDIAVARHTPINVPPSPLIRTNSGSNSVGIGSPLTLASPGRLRSALAAAGNGLIRVVRSLRPRSGSRSSPLTITTVPESSASAHITPPSADAARARLLSLSSHAAARSAVSASGGQG